MFCDVLLQIVCVPFTWRITILFIVLINAAVSVFLEVSDEMPVSYLFYGSVYCTWPVLVSKLAGTQFTQFTVHVGHCVHSSC